MVNDVDHVLRMHITRAVTSLFLAQAHLTGDDPLPSIHVTLLDQKGQEEMFQQVMDSLRLAYFISDGLHELSSEDESVNRVSSLIYSLQLEACVSPVCEPKVVSELVLAVKRGHIEADLMDKVLTHIYMYIVVVCGIASTLFFWGGWFMDRGLWWWFWGRGGEGGQSLGGIVGRLRWTVGISRGQ